MSNFTGERENVALKDIEQLPKVFSVMAHAQKPKSALTPLYQRGGTTRNCLKSPPLEKGDLRISTWKEFMANALGNIKQVSAPRFALIFITENRKPETENPGPRPR
jgi:hypothetical protein